jgi:hypothetical protein
MLVASREGFNEPGSSWQSIDLEYFGETIRKHGFPTQ